MQLLEERILKDGTIKPGNILKVDSFLNHQMDIPFINEIIIVFFVTKFFIRLIASFKP